MLHAIKSDDEADKKDKIEQFLNLYLQNYQAAFYPDRNLSLDELVVKLKCCPKAASEIVKTAQPKS